MTQPVVKKMKYKLRMMKKLLLPYRVNVIKGRMFSQTNLLVILALEEKVISTDDGTDSLYIVVRRKAQLERKLNLWKRATNKVTPEHNIRVKFIGEDGIDTGALAKEFLTENISDIKNQLFPDGNPYPLNY